MRAATDELVEREQELGLIESALDDSGTSGGRFVLVEAPAGLGKTALLRHAEAVARRRGLRVLSARGSELERDYPFALVGQLLEPLLGDVSPRERDALLSGAASLALPALAGRRGGGEPGPEAAGDGRAALEPVPSRSGTADGEDPGYATLHGLYWLVSNASEAEPVVMAIDDLHWADAASLRFLSFLEARLEGMRVALVCTRRPREPGVEEGLLARVGSTARVVAIAPRPLTRRGTAELLAHRFGRSPDPAFAAACHEACAGNPFYLEVLAEELLQLGTAPAADGIARIDSLAPEALARTILVRLGRLGPEATALAKAVAVLGDGAHLEVAAELAERPLEVAATAVRELARVSIFRRTATLAFVHPIVRATVYQELSPHERADAHRRAARLLERGGAPPEQVASQLMRAAPRGEAAVVETLLAAARRATERGASDGAMAYLARALNEPPTVEERPRVLAALGEAEARAAKPSAIEHLRKARDTAGEPAARAEVSLVLGRALLIGGRLPEAVELLEAAAQETRGHDAELSARLAIEAAGARRLVPGGDPPTDLDAIAASVPADSPARQLFAWAKARDATLEGRSPGRLADVRQLDHRLLRQEGIASQGFVTLVNMLTYFDHFERAREVIEEALGVARRVGSVAGFATMSACRAALNRRLGRLAEAEADATAALDAAEAGGMQIIEPMMLAELLEIRVERGAVDEADAALAARDRADEPPAPNLGTMFFLCARGRVRCAGGDPRSALADFDTCARGLESLGVSNPALIAWRSYAALAHLALGEREAAHELAEDEVRLARRCEVATALGRALRVRALVDGDRAIALLHESRDVLEPGGPTLERAHTLVELGGALRRAGHRAQAREPLRQGLELARSFGAEPLAERAHTELRAAGARPRRPVRTGLDALTPSEQRIAAMAAGGLSNAEIAQSLFVTLRTVETHLTHAYGKLEIAGRAQLSGALEQAETT